MVLMKPRCFRSAPWQAAAVALTAAVGLVPTADAASAADHADQTTCVRHCAAGDLMKVTLARLHPTQPAVGYDQIHYKLGRYASDKDEDRGDVNQRFEDWCETNGQGKAADADSDSRLDDPGSFTCEVDLGDETPETMADMKTVVIGPGGELYLTDGHHTFTTFWETPDGGPGLSIRVKVAADMSDLSPSQFWQRMRDENRVWLHDENDAPITVDQLPPRLGLAEFGDDQYRSLVYFTGDIGYGEVAQPSEFLEFYWGRWLRQSYDLSTADLCDHSQYLDLVKAASQDMTALDDDDLVSDGKTAAQLGKLAEWNNGDPVDEGEFADLAKPMSKGKPGKLAYALDHKCAA